MTDQKKKPPLKPTKTDNFFNLDPENVLVAAELAGFEPTGLFTQLNSYENRVFDIRMENNESLIAKFYRPGRWNYSAISEEHDFLQELNQDDIPCLQPLILSNNSTIIEHQGIYVSFFPKFKGRMPQELLEPDFNRLGQLLARVHNVGARKEAPHRPYMDTSYYGGWQTLNTLQNLITPEVRTRYLNAAENILDFIDAEFDPSEFIRIHGDCHKGNVLQHENLFYLVDFDDFANGPIIQDFWMLFNYNHDTLQKEKDLLVEGYEMFREFPFHQWDWVEALRGLRIIMYAGWIAKRWSDPSFPKLFPDFGSYSYWAEETEALEKIAWSL
ncbi:MAG: serine/threonine protein kinase [Bdellovibrionaceae bacterium]|nr:serine/threonine protein kinase [Pseudobdellovibrionaceae bacterium]NUM58509.1 serine/threonine protein kinase [Pseudobdellovibrionaceae bacterium]